MTTSRIIQARELVRDVRNNKRWLPNIAEGKVVKFFYSEVVAVELMPGMPTYGITVDVDHSHVSEGVVTHNTGPQQAVGVAAHSAAPAV